MFSNVQPSFAWNVDSLFLDFLCTCIRGKEKGIKVFNFHMTLQCHVARLSIVIEIAQKKQGKSLKNYMARGRSEAQLQRAKTTTFSTEGRAFQSVNSIACLSAARTQKMATLL